MVDLWGRSWSRESLLERVGSLGQVADVTLSKVDDGPATGVRMATFRNAGLLSFDVLLDRASDIGRADVLGRPVAFWSDVGPVGPWFREPQADGFLRGFAGGLLTTGGLDHAFAPEQDPPPSPDGATTGHAYPLHGRVTGSRRSCAATGRGGTATRASCWSRPRCGRRRCSARRWRCAAASAPRSAARSSRCATR